MEKKYLDIGCGNKKREGFIGMDQNHGPGVDVVHNLESFPYPFEDESIDMINASHVMEHIDPRLIIKMMDELWRILKINGLLVVEMPYGGSITERDDPTHFRGWTELTFRYFDPRYDVYKIYHPKPWNIEQGQWQTVGNIQVVMKKVRGDESL